MFVKLCVIILSMFTSIVTIFSPVPDVGAMPIDADPDFVPVLRFVASSDSHVKKSGDLGCTRIMKMINTGYAAAEADENYKKLDAAIMSGDITNGGLPTAFCAVNASVKKVLKDETDFLAVAAKNHDSYAGRISRGYVSGISGDKADFHKVINGFHFIGLSASPTSLIHYTKSQIRWLDEQLAEAVADDPAKPVFVFQHEHIYDTVYGSLPGDGWGVEFFTDILSKYPQVIDISGHSHYPANDPRAIWQGAFTALNDGGLAYYEFTIDGATSQHPESGDTMAHCLLVEVDADNRVKIRVCDLTADEVLAEYLVDNVADPVKTKYAFDTRKAAASAPVFDEEPEVTVSDKTAAITVKPAKASAEDVVFIYRVTVTDADGKTAATFKKLGNYYKSLTPEDVKFSFTAENAGEYTVSVIAEDVWGLASAPAVTAFTVG